MFVHSHNYDYVLYDKHVNNSAQKRGFPLKFLQ